MSDDFDDLYGSQYLAAADVKKPITTTIAEIDKRDFAKQAERQKMKVVLYLKGAKKPIVLNKTNALNLSEQFGKNFDDWIDKRVTVRAEPTTFGGKRIMGLRIYPARWDPPEPKGLKPQKPADDGGGFGDNDDGGFGNNAPIEA